MLTANGPCAPEAQQRIAAAFGSPTADQGLRAQRQHLDAPVALRDYGMPEGGIAPAVQPVLAQAPPANPAPLDIHHLTSLIRAAWEGDLP